jgi:N-acetylgalactosamine-N,N'-diacetylbacillosaminyl-diphospho-undecaprenol 4-alpha-N-acetylgalactosaminyltransferase
VLQKKQKICLVSDCLAIGGAEKVAAELSLFFDKNGFEVNHVIVQNKIVYEYAGSVLNLGLHTKNSLVNKIRRLWIFHKFIKHNKFDFIIDFRVKNHRFQEFVISRLIYNSKTIFAIHNFMLNLYFPKNKILSKYTFHNRKIVSISNEIKQQVESNFGFDDIATIYNPIDLKKIRTIIGVQSNFDFEYIVAAGTMTVIKQFDQIINCYANSVLPESNIKLVFLGDGVEEKKLRRLAANLKLQNKIIFKGRVENPFIYYTSAKYLVLGSKFEGLPMVLIESLACGTPVISFDCKSGPNEIIIENKNGLLVENQNFEALTIAMNKLISDTELYVNCKNYSIPSIQKFEINAIGNQWLEYFKTL